MKKLILISFCIIPFMTINIALFSQGIDSTDIGSLKAGTDCWYMISINNQSPVKAKILSDDGVWVVIEEKNISPKEIVRATITSIEEASVENRGTVGIGFGLPYGGLGINCEINVIPYISLTAGLGTTIIVGTGYEIGAKGYFRKEGTIWKPRASVYYGVNGFHYVEKNHPDNELYSGFTAGLGQLFLWQKHGFDLDLMYVFNSKLYDEHPESNGKIKFSIGYRYAF